MNGPDHNHDSKLEGAEKLLGGYASKNLSEQEKQALFDAALHDQQLFNALMEEQALQDLLETPGVKPELIQALQAKATLRERFQKWLKTPMAWGAGGALATAVVLVAVIVPSMINTKTRSTATVWMRSAPEQPKEFEARQPEPQPQFQKAVPRPVAPPPARQRLPELRDSVTPPRVSSPPPEPAVQAVDMARQAAQEAAAPAAAPAPVPVPVPTSEQPARERRDEKREQLVVQPVPAMRNPPGASAPPAAFGLLSAAALSVDYTLLRRNAEGAFEPATSVRANEAVRLQVTPSQAGYLYLYRRDANGVNTTIVGAQRVAARQAVVVPSQGELVAGNQQYLLTFARDTNISITNESGAIGGQGLRKMKRAAEADSAANSVRSVPSSSLPSQKAILPSASTGRASASPADPNTVAIEIRITPTEP